MRGEYVNCRGIIPFNANISFSMSEVDSNADEMDVSYNGEIYSVGKFDVFATEPETLEDIDILCGISKKMSQMKRFLCYRRNPCIVDTALFNSGGWLEEGQTWQDVIFADMPTKYRKSVLSNLVYKIAQEENIGICEMQLIRNRNGEALYRVYATDGRKDILMEFPCLAGINGAIGFLNQFLKGRELQTNKH